MRQAASAARPLVAGALVFAAIVASLALPGPPGEPARRVANADPDGRGPIYNIEVDDDAMRRAGRLLPDDARYAVWFPPEEIQYLHDLLGAGLLYFTPAVAVRNPKRADWVLSYRVTPRLPRGVRALQAIEVAPGIELVRVAPS